MTRDAHIQPERNEDRHEIFDRLHKSHKERELVASKADPHFNQYMKDRQKAHEATKEKS